MRRRIFSVVVPTMITLVVASCVGSADGPAEQSRGHYTNGTFTMALAGDAGPFDPYRSQLIFATAYLAYDPLVHMLPDGKFVSGVAEKWTADAASATFTLRKDVTCSDGTPLTARQVAAAINYVTDPKNQSPQYGVSTPTVPLKITGDDASRSVRVVAEKPFGFLLNTIGQLPIVCAKGLANHDVLRTASDGTGPFVLTKVVPGQSYTFTMRKNYRWGPDGAGTDAPGTPSTVVLKVVENETTAANLLLAGDLNFAQITGQDQQRLNAGGLQKVEVPMSGAWLWLNHAGSRPTADKSVRQALVQGLNLGQVVKVNTGGVGKASRGLVAMAPRPCTADTLTGALPEYDMAAANALLDQSGWSRDTNGIRQKSGKPLALNLHYPAYGSVYNKPTAELLAQAWKGIGVQVKLTADSRTELGKVMFSTGDFDVYMLGFGFILPNQMVPYLSGQAPPKGTNLSAVDNAEFNSLAAAAQSKTPPAACDDWSKAEKALYRNVDIVPISDRPNLYYLKKAEAESSGFEIPIPTSIRTLK